eukprot:2386997-Prymnesium_polylepis.1
MGAGDFAPSYLERHMLRDVGDDLEWLEKANALYINVGLVARKVDETGGTISATFLSNVSVSATVAGRRGAAAMATI